MTLDDIAITVAIHEDVLVIRSGLAVEYYELKHLPFVVIAMIRYVEKKFGLDW